jgi:hypothetical protein
MKEMVIKSLISINVTVMHHTVYVLTPLDWRVH